MTKRHKYTIAAISILAVLTASVLFPEQSLAATGGSGLPWEEPINRLSRSIQGPVAYILCLLALIGSGGRLLWGGEIGDVLRSFLLLGVVISVTIAAAGFLTSLFNTSGALIY